MKHTLIALCCISVVACGKIETGNLGLRTEFNGHVTSIPVPEGFYTSFTSHVNEFSMKEIPVNLDNLTPKAKDNLLLQELDVTVYYKVTPEKLYSLWTKYTGQTVENPDNSAILWPMYGLVKSVSQSEIANAVSTIESMTIHTKREELEKQVRAAVQANLDASDPGAFTVTRVVVRGIKTDPSVENAIRQVVAKNKELEAATLDVKIAQQRAEANAKTAQTLTPEFLQHEYYGVLRDFAQHGGTLILDGSASNKILNVQK